MIYFGKSYIFFDDLLLLIGIFIVRKQFSMTSDVISLNRQKNIPKEKLSTLSLRWKCIWFVALSSSRLLLGALQVTRLEMLCSPMS